MKLGKIFITGVLAFGASINAANEGAAPLPSRRASKVRLQVDPVVHDGSRRSSVDRRSSVETNNAPPAPSSLRRSSAVPVAAANTP